MVRLRVRIKMVGYSKRILIFLSKDVQENNSMQLGLK